MKRPILLLFAIVLMGACLRQPELPVLGQLPDFQLINEKGQPVGLSDLKGQVWAVNFIFTSCGGTCPLLTRKMTRVQAFIQKEGWRGKDSPVKIISISVDPDRDTPEVLADYAKSFGANPEIWSFLTGSFGEIEKTVVQGFKMAMGKVKGAPGDESADPGFYDVVHGERFILVDQQGRIRGYFSADKDGITRLNRGIKTLVNKAS